MKVDINQASNTWTIIPGKKFMPSFTTIKSIGGAAVKDILDRRPYKNVDDLLWNEDGTWKHSKFNKRVMENLIKIGAFESMDIVGEGKHFSSYRQMHACIIENWALLKKKSGRKLLTELVVASSDIEDWTREEKAAMYVELVGELDLDLVIPPALKQRLTDKGVTSVDAAMPDEKCIHWLVVVDATPAKTKKGKSYLRLQCVGESGEQHRMFVWGWKPDGPQIKKYYGYLAEVEKSSFGLATTPWKMREIDI